MHWNTVKKELIYNYSECNLDNCNEPLTTELYAGGPPGRCRVERSRHDSKPASDTAVSADSRCFRPGAALSSLEFAIFGSWQTLSLPGRSRRHGGPFHRQHAFLQRLFCRLHSSGPTRKLRFPEPCRRPRHHSLGTHICAGKQPFAVAIVCDPANRLF